MRHQRGVINDAHAAWHYGCTTSAAEVVVRTGTRISLIVSMVMLIVCAFVISRMSSADDRVSAAHRAEMLEGTTLPPVYQPVPREHADEGAGIPDLYGNEVSDAVARYKADGAGALYEVHSPQTEVPRLGSPKS